MRLDGGLMRGLARRDHRGLCHLLVGALLMAWTAAGVQAQVNPNAQVESARQAMAQGRFGAAAEIYAELARAFPGEPSLQANLGMALHFGGRDSEAIEPLRQAARALPESFPAHFALGASLSRLGRYAEAVAPLRAAMRADSGHLFAQVLLGEALEAAGAHAEAAGVWRAVTELEGGGSFGFAGLVRSHEELAAVAVEQLRQRDPESPYMLRFLGQARLAAQQYPSALYLFRGALEREPGVRAVHEAVASVYEGSGQPEWARIEREKAASLPALDCTAKESAECHFAAGRYDLAPPVAVDSSPADLFWAARSHARLAEGAFEKLVGQPESEENLALVADLLASQGRYSAAADACRRAIEIGGGTEDLERQLAELLFLAKRTEEALPMLERFRKADSRDPRWAAMLGNLMAQQQDYEKAVPLLESSLSLPGAPTMAAVDLGRSYLALGRPEEALPHLKASLPLDSDGSIHYQLAQAFQRLGMRDEAREALAQYRELEGRARQRTEAGASLDITPPQ